jgi:hypothetical protein
MSLIILTPKKLTAKDFNINEENPEKPVNNKDKQNFEDKIKEIINISEFISKKKPVPLLSRIKQQLFMIFESLK